jgi:hypothetical protein
LLSVIGLAVIKGTAGGDPVSGGFLAEIIVLSVLFVISVAGVCRDDRSVLRAESADELLILIRDDYRDGRSGGYGAALRRPVAGRGRVLFTCMAWPWT